MRRTGYIVKLIAVILIAAIFTGCVGGINNTKEPGKAPDVSIKQTKRPKGEVGIFAAIGSGNEIATGMPDANYISSMNEFSIEVLRQLGDDWSGVVSPLSIQLALQLAANGANAELTAEIIKLIFNDTNNVEEANVNAAKLLRALSIDETASLSQKNKNTNAAFNITNAVVLDCNLELEDEYEKNAGDYFDAFIATLDFEDKEGSLKALNNWILERTCGLINDMLSELPDNTAAAIINTIYFNDEWVVPFNAFKTPTTFHGKNGDAQVTMLKSSSDYELVEVENGKAVLLPYASGQYYMAVVLPSEGTHPVDALAAVIGCLNEDEGNRTGLSNGMRKKTHVTVTMPAVQLKSDIDIVPIIENMGVHDLTSENAISSMAKNRSLTIADVLHSAGLNVTEKGTEAGASTAIIMNEKSVLDLGVEFTCDRPYAMAIVNSETGAVLFVSVVNDIPTIG